MTRYEARKEIFKLFNTEYLREIGGTENMNPVDGLLLFYFWLQDKHPKALDFPDTGDRYQTLYSWVYSPSDDPIKSEIHLTALTEI